MDCGFMDPVIFNDSGSILKFSLDFGQGWFVGKLPTFFDDTNL